MILGNHGFLLPRILEETLWGSLNLEPQSERDFTPLVYSVDGCAGRETKAAERKLAGALAGKWDREYSEMVAYVRTRMALAVVRANTLLIRGSRSRRARRPHIDEGAAMNGWRVWRDMQ